uniref:ABC-type transport auxiliary lipoprotein component domain-containing protein n=1 Tax=uncultured Helicobacter sp. TaxID=175537 RepID=A0A650ELZ2_9HELI|nr:hypothetical protein Helico6505_1330 [uncultured Helicobacter sp.]
MKKIFFAVMIIAGISWTGCVNVKIASEIPSISYFDIQDYETSKNTKKCQNQKTSKKIGVLDVNVASVFNSTDVIVINNETLKIESLENKKWVSTPKEMFKTKILYALKNQCYEASLQPFGTQKLDKILKITLTSFAIIKKTEGYFAQVGLFYEIQNAYNYSLSKNDTIIVQKPVQFDGDFFALDFRDLSDEAVNLMIKSIR